MEAIIAILLIVVIFILSQQNGKLRLLDRRLTDLAKDLKQAQQSKPEIPTVKEEPVAVRPFIEAEPHEKVELIPDPIENEPAREPEKTEEPVEEMTPAMEQPSPVEQEPEPVFQTSAHSIKQIISEHKGLKKKQSPRKSFLEKNPDLEKFIGENLLSKIGIVIFVIGMGFLVKLGIDNNIITEPMRIAIGVVVAGGMVGLAHYLRNSFANFSSVLIGGALAVLYYTIALGFHEYELIPYPAAFIIMIAITGFAVLLSIAYDRKELAVLAILGGFGTPFFLSTGEGNLASLLVYLVILDLGMLILAYFRKWPLITYIAYGFSYFLFLFAVEQWYYDDPISTRLSLFLYLTVIYVIFFFMTIVYNVRYNIKFKYPEMGMLLTNSSLYFGLGLMLVNGHNDGQFNGLFTTLVAAFNFVFAFVLYRKDGVDKNLLYLLIGLVLTFLSLIAPIQLNGNYITMFWALEAVLLLWLAQKSQMQLMKLVSVIVTGLMLISLAMDWEINYVAEAFGNNLSLFFNKSFIASLVAIAALMGLVLLLKSDEEIEFRNIKFNWKRSYVASILGIVVYLAFLFEFSYQVKNFELIDSLGVILIGIYNFVFVSILWLTGRFSPLKVVRTVAFWASLVLVFFYVTIFTAAVIESRDYAYLSQGMAAGFAWHYVLLALLFYLVLEASLYFEEHYSFKSSLGEKALWALAILGTIITSVEVTHLAMVIQYSPNKIESLVFDTVIRSVLPVVWTISALLMMILGMKLRLKTLRIASLALFTITIIKLFFYDLAGNTTGRIVSFIFLGAILLVISFLYQKLKFIIQDDEKKDLE